MDNKSLPGQLKALRVLRGMERDEFARRVGVTRQAVEHWESGRRTPPLKKLEKVAAVLHVELQLRLVPAAADTDDHAAALLLRLAEVLPRVPVARRRVLLAQLEELEEQFPAPPTTGDAPDPRNRGS
jgi:transcriptional regulator with XRE-family HTH domain